VALNIIAPNSNSRTVTISKTHSIVISWLSVLLVEETGVSGENNLPAAIHRQTLSYPEIDGTFLINIHHI
jgi:hypothetical protein